VKSQATALATPEEVRAHLIAAARAGTSLTYAELLQQLGYSFSRPKMRQLCSILSAVDDRAQANGEPELAVLVVRQSDRIPGQGWWVGRAPPDPGTIASGPGQSAPAGGGAGSRGYEGPREGPEAVRFIRLVQSKTFAFWQCQSGTESRAAPVNHSCSPVGGEFEA
jgi:hypothetical protein